MIGQERVRVLESGSVRDFFVLFWGPYLAVLGVSSDLHPGVTPRGAQETTWDAEGQPQSGACQAGPPRAVLSVGPCASCCDVGVTGGEQSARGSQVSGEEVPLLTAMVEGKQWRREK